MASLSRSFARPVSSLAVGLLLLTSATTVATELPAALKTDAYMTWPNLHVEADLGQPSLGLAPLQTVIAAFMDSTDHFCVVNPVRESDYRVQQLTCDTPSGRPAISAQLRYADNLYVLTDLKVAGRPVHGPAAVTFLKKVVPIQTMLDKFRILANAPEIGPVDIGTLDEVRKNLAANSRGSSCTSKVRAENRHYEVECSVKYRTYSFTLKNNGHGNLVLWDLQRDARPLNAAQKADAFREVFDIDPNHP
ncbi:hypothetical protein [Methylobacterium iners]|uniref:Uncharacterized protein n=1 Tax=Methylobacterium iners TaxID=418707 RepID=A0ABQ4RQY8_9HYPH|nr:hypothetical protein [Methylobacterium iners]GJD93144.1 hypothetical protein OCOJLMKI_0334 [Methylobacterium iners]